MKTITNVGLTKEQIEHLQKSRRKTVESKIWQVITENEPIEASKIIAEDLPKLFNFLKTDEIRK